MLQLQLFNYLFKFRGSPRSRRSMEGGEGEFLRAFCGVEAICHMTLGQSEGGKAVGVAWVYDAHVLGSHRYEVINQLSRPEKVSELNELVCVVENQNFIFLPRQFSSQWLRKKKRSLFSPALLFSCFSLNTGFESRPNMNSQGMFFWLLLSSLGKSYQNMPGKSFCFFQIFPFVERFLWLLY